MMENISFDLQIPANFCDYPVHGPLVHAYFTQGILYLLYSLIFVISVVGNGLVCYIVISTPRMRTVTNYFIMNLAVGDILSTIFCVPFTAIPYIQQYWPFGSIACPVVSLFQAMPIYVSAYTMLVISVDRYFAIMWPLKPRISKKIAASVILFIWFFSTFLALPIPILSRLRQPPEFNDSISQWYNFCDR